MSQFFDQASLVMVPSGYKTGKVYSQKPLSADGQLAFTRSNDTASRVAENGLIEKVRTNLLTYSEQLDNAAWNKVSTTIVANAVANPINAAVTADKMTDTNTTTATRYTQQNVASSGTTYTSSGYFKKAEYNFVTLHAFGLNGAVFNLDTGVKVSQSGGVGTITSIGGGWYRCSFAFTAGGAGIYFSQSPTIDFTYTGTTGSGIYAFGLQLETGDIATNYIATTSAAVSVGPVANLPRLDYSGGATCPKLLLEPQRTNIKTNSENGTGGNWGNPYQVVVTANETNSPDGYVNADSVADTALLTPHRFEPNFNATNGTTYTLSYFAKANTLTQCHIYGFTDNYIFSGQKAIFNLSNGTIVSNTGGGIANIVNYGSGWYRVSLTLTAAATALGYWGFGTSKDGADLYIGDGSNLYMWGIQLEASAHATSYIPTLGAATTRGADSCGKTGISSLIGQTEGTLYWEGKVDGLGSFNEALPISLFATGATTSGAQIYVTFLATGRISYVVYDGTTVQAQLQTATSFYTLGTNIKIAAVYKANDFALYINGVQIGTDTSGSVPAMAELYFDYQNNIGKYSAAQALLFKTRLTNAQLAEITSL